MDNNNFYINLKQAVLHWYKKSSYDMVYTEAVANALDADATEISIRFKASKLSDESSFYLEIQDNGVGFTDERYAQFSSLMNVQENDICHRGLGRLVYLFYFNNVHIKSFLPTKTRDFDFSGNIQDVHDAEVENKSTGSIIVFKDYRLSKLKDIDYADPQWIACKLLHKFISRLNEAKCAGKHITINISSSIGETQKNAQIDSNNIPKFEEYPYISQYTTDGEMMLLYSIRPCPIEESSVVTALSIDARDEEISLFAEPILGYDMIFVLKSTSFDGGIDDQRMEIELKHTDKQKIQTELIAKIREIVNISIPSVEIKRGQILQKLVNKYPHLQGYFDEDAITVFDEKEILQIAQNKFAKAQMELMTKTKLSTDDYTRSMELSGRLLTQYILFRQFILNKLQDVTLNDNEDVIHNILVPRYNEYSGDTMPNDLFSCNLWVLDDKFMTYRNVLSEKETAQLIKILAGDEIKNSERPDIAVIFSANPNSVSKVDVVIIELKKKGLKPGDNMKVEYQLEQRARALYPYYKDKIQTMWLYGICEMTEEYEAHLDSAGYSPLYSKGKIFYSTHPITVSLRPEKITVPANRYVLDYNALVNDATDRNSAFLNLIKSVANTSNK